MATKKMIEVVATGGNVKYGGKYRVPGTDTARFKCEEKIALGLVKAKVVVDAKVFDAQQSPVEEQPEQGEPVEVTLDLLRAEYPEIVEQLEGEAREGMCTKEQFEEAVANSTKGLFTQTDLDAATAEVPTGYVAETEVDEALSVVPDGYVAQVDVDAQVKKLQGEIKELKKKS